LIHNLRGLDNLEDIIEDKMREQFQKDFIEEAQLKMKDTVPEGQIEQAVQQIKDYVCGSTLTQLNQ